MCDVAPGEPGEPGDELCNGLDDDCDGSADEGLGLGDACAVAVAGDVAVTGCARGSRIYMHARGPDGQWRETDVIDHDRGDRFGFAPEFYPAPDGGLTLFVGAPLENGDAASTLDAPNDDPANAGAVFVFRRGDDGAWARTGYLKARVGPDPRCHPSAPPPESGPVSGCIGGAPSL